MLGFTETVRRGYASVSEHIHRLIRRTVSEAPDMLRGSGIATHPAMAVSITGAGFATINDGCGGAYSSQNGTAT